MIEWLTVGGLARTGAEVKARKKKSRWEEPSPSTALALSHVPKEITLPGGIKVILNSGAAASNTPRFQGSGRQLFYTICICLPIGHQPG